MLGSANGHLYEVVVVACHEERLDDLGDPDDARAEFARSNPQGRIVQPQEVADAVSWLCSAGAGSITGQSVSVSGGEVM